MELESPLELSASTKAFRPRRSFGQELLLWRSTFRMLSTVWAAAIC
jgi:hypothetical protein